MLEQALRNGRHTASAGNAQLESHLANLQFENQRLRNSRQQAASRLTALMEKLQTQLDTTPSSPEPFAPATSQQQEHAA